MKITMTDGFFKRGASLARYPSLKRSPALTSLGKAIAMIVTCTSLFCGWTAKAAYEIYSGALIYPNVSFTTMGAFESVNIIDGQVSMQMAVDPLALKLKFEKIRISIPVFNYSKTDSYTAGFGLTKNITTTISFNELTYDLTIIENPLHLTAGTGGNYSVGEENIGLEVDFSPLRLRGSYTVKGPTETISNNFDVITGSYRGGLSFPKSLNTIEYPDTLSLNGGISTSFAPQLNIINVLVDGINVSWGIYSIEVSGGGYYDTNTLKPGDLSTVAIPESSTYAMLVGFVSLCAVVFLRRKTSR